MGGAYLSFSFVGNAHIAPRISDSPSPQRHKRRHPQTESRSATGRLQRLNTGLPGPFPIYGGSVSGISTNVATTDRKVSHWPLNAWLGCRLTEQNFRMLNLDQDRSTDDVEVLRRRINNYLKVTEVSIAKLSKSKKRSHRARPPQAGLAIPDYASKFYHCIHPSALRRTSRSRVSTTGFGFVSSAAARSSASWREMNSLSVIIASVVSARSRVRAANSFRLEQVC